MAAKGGVTSEASQLGRCGGALKRAGVLGVGLVESIGKIWWGPEKGW